MGKTIIDLVTGFLGAGKTTFILKYRTYCKGQGQKIHIIENEFCGYDVDTEILAQAGDKPSSLAGECLCCTGKEHFKELLLTCSSQDYYRIIVEPSGIYDVGEFFALFEDPEITAVCQIGSIMTIVDPAGLTELSEETEYLLFLQLSSAGTVLISKTEICKESLVRNVAPTIARIMEKNGIPFDFFIHKDTLIVKNWASLTDTDYSSIQNAGYHSIKHMRHEQTHNEIFDTIMLNASFENRQAIKEKIEALSDDKRFGNVLRIKGYAGDLQKKRYLINCTPNHQDITPSENRRGLLVIIGQDLNENEIRRLLTV